MKFLLLIIVATLIGCNQEIEKPIAQEPPAASKDPNPVKVQKNTKPKPQAEKHPNYTATPIVEMHYLIKKRKDTINNYNKAVFKVQFNRDRPRSIYDAALTYSSMVGYRHALFTATGKYRGTNMSIQLIAEIDPKKMYIDGSRMDEGYYQLKGIKTYRTVIGGNNSVIMLDKYGPLLEKQEEKP